MGSETINAGGAGMGIRVKIINNYMSIALNALSVMNGTPAGKGHFTTTCPGKVLAGNLSPAFMVDLATK